MSPFDSLFSGGAGMTKLRCTLAAVVLALASASSPAGAQLNVGLKAGQEIGDRIEVNTVNVEVSVTDKDGRPVAGLKRGDFELREDGKRVEIANFDAVTHKAAVPQNAPETTAVPQSAEQAPAEGSPEPASWVLYIDDAFIQPSTRARVLSQLREFLTHQLAPGDQVMVATYDNSLRIRLPFTKDRSTLAWALDQAGHLSAHGNELERERRTLLAMLVSEYEMQFSYIKKKDGGGQRKAAEADESAPDQGAPGFGGGGAGCPQSVPQAVKAYAGALRQQVLSSADALTVLVNSLSGLPGRKVILHVSDGIPITPGEEIFQILIDLCGDSGSTLSTKYFGNQAALDAQSYSTVKDWTALAAHANAQRVTLYTFQAGGAGSLGGAADMGPEDKLLNLPAVTSVASINRQQPLSVLAHETGGRAVFWATDIRADLARVQEDLASYYSLGFNPSHFGDGREHRLEVRIKRPGVTLRYRQSYRDKPALERTVDRTLSSLFYGYEDNPLDIRLEVGQAEAGSGASWTVPVRLRIPLFKLGLQTRSGVYEGKLRVLVAVRSAGGESTPIRQVQVPIHIPHGQALTALGQFYQYELTLTLKPGDQNLAVAVRDEATTETSFLARTLHIGTAEAK
jgi:VWFA-related protein